MPGRHPGTGGGAGYANHSEYNYVLRNLVVKIPDEVSLEEASCATVGSIALQGVRQCDLGLGENVCVMGLGLQCPCLRENTAILGVGFIGAGNFTRSVLLPVLKKQAHVQLKGICTATGMNAAQTAGGRGLTMRSPIISSCWMIRRSRPCLSPPGIICMRQWWWNV